MIEIKLMEAFLGFREIIPASSILLISIFLQIYSISGEGHACTTTNGNYTQNSTFHSNLNTILTSLSSNINTTNGFYYGNAGNGVDQVNVMANCRGDVDIGTCRDCVNDEAKNLITQLCPNQKEAIVWVDNCMFRYSNNSILGILSLSPSYHVVNTQNASDVDLYSPRLSSFAENLTIAAHNGSPRKFARMISSAPNAATVYGFMQCTPDLTPAACLACLNWIANDLSSCCYTHVGAQMRTPSCIYRFEIFDFLKDTSNQPPPPPLLPPLPPSPTPLPPLLSPAGPPPPPSTHHKGRSNAAVITVVCVIVALFVLSLIAACVFFNKKSGQKTIRSGHTFNEVEELQAIGDGQTREYDFALIRAVTNDFSTANLLGNGGFGPVYKGVLSNGKEIAVKRLSKSSGQGEEEFRNEVILLAKLQHKCLVRLLGFCLEQTERLLIYEFMANGSLDNFLFNGVNRSKLDWGVRYKIITNVAKGLLYLHEDSRLRIIHRDLKASNILLDEEMNAKISDFGTARLFVWDESEANTTRIAGTMGYMAPEYAMHGIFSVKSDVYSYGVLLLEILSGKRNRNSNSEDGSEGLLSYAYKTWKDGRGSDLIDPILTAHSYSQEIIIRCIHIALLCVQEHVASRPTMATVVLMLQSLTMTMPIPSEPGFFNNTRTWLSDIHESTSSSNESKSISVHGGARNDTSLNDEDADSYLYPR